MLAPNLGPILSFRTWNSLTCAHSLLLEKYSESWQLRHIDTFYMFINISKTGMKSEEFAYKLLEKAHIAVVPGVAYGDMYDDYVRVAFTKEIDVLKIAIDRLKRFI